MKPKFKIMQIVFRMMDNKITSFTIGAVIKRDKEFTYVDNKDTRFRSDLSGYEISEKIIFATKEALIKSL